MKTNPEGSWAQEEIQIDHGVNSGELVISGIYVRLFIANPGWVLRKPREFLTDLLENAINTMKSQNPDLQRLEEVTTALVKLLSAQPALAEIVPATGYISRIFSVMGGLDENGIKSAMLIIAELSRSSVCVENMATCPNSILPWKRGLSLRKDLIGVSCDALSRIFSGHHDSLVRQALDCKLVDDLLGKETSSKMIFH